MDSNSNKLDFVIVYYTRAELSVAKDHYKKIITLAFFKIIKPKLNVDWLRPVNLLKKSRSKSRPGFKIYSQDKSKKGRSLLMINIKQKRKVTL